MTIYILRRLYQALIVLLLVTVIVFSILHFSGDPIQILMPMGSTPEQVEQMRSSFGLDKPVVMQYLLFLKNALQGNLGISYHHGQPAATLVLERLPATLELGLVAVGMALLVAIPLGVLAATNRGNVWDKATLLGSLLGVSAPVFWVGLVLIYVFCVELGWLPSSGRGRWSQLILPAGSLAFYQLAVSVRLLRAEMLDHLRLDYVRTARAKGLSQRVVIFKHAFRNTLIPFVTISGLQMGALLTGSIVTERVFAWPGMGRLLLDSVYHLDLPVIIAWSLLTSLLFLTINFTVDIMYIWLDPRIRYER